MFVIAVVKKNGAHKFINGATRTLKRGWEMRIEKVFSMYATVETDEDDTFCKVTVNTMDGLSHTFDAEYWDVHAVSEADDLFEEEE